MTNTIEVSHLSKHYHRGKIRITAVGDLSLSVPAGQVIGFLGQNGAGKTTTIKMICGLVTPSSGTVTLNGFDNKRQRSQAMRQIGAVLEGTRNVYWRLSAWDNLLYFGRIKGKSGKGLEATAARLLQELELWDRRDSKVGEFSRGMQQKVAIACALIADPPIVLLDEPTLGLDVQAAHTIESWITRLARQEGKTVVLTTHQLDMAQKVCDRVAIIREGHLIADQPMSELLELFSLRGPGSRAIGGTDSTARIGGYGAEYYEIKLKGNLTSSQLNLPDGLIAIANDTETTITGSLESQAALHDLLGKLHDQGLILDSVRRAYPDLEEVFVRLTSG